MTTTPRPTPAARPATRRRADLAALGIVLLAALLLHGWIAAWDHYATTFTDSIDYLFMADFYRALLYGGDLETAAEFYRLTRFPPVFPLLLGLFGAGTEHQHAAAFISNAIAVAAAVAVWCWVRIERGDPWTAALVALGMLAYPHYFALNQTPISEPLGILVTATVFALLARQPVTRSRVLAAALLVGLAPLARTALLPLCIAFPIWLAWRRPLPWRQAWLPLLAAWAPFLAWTVYRRLLGAHQYASYLSAEQYAEAGMAWPAVLWQQPLRVFHAVTQGWGIPSPPAWLVAISAVLTVLAALGCVLRLRQNRPDAWFLAGYVALILIWPFPAEHTRFIIAVYPFVLVCALSVCDWLGGWMPARAARAPGVALLLLVALASAPGVAKFAHRAAMPVPEPLLGEKREPAFFILPDDAEALAGMEINGRARMLLQEARNRIPPGACLYSLPPQFGRLYTKRRVLAYPRALGTDPERVRARLAECDYYFIGAWKSRIYHVPPLYPSAGLDGWTEAVLVSSMKFNGRPLIAAALLRRKDEAAAVDAPLPSPGEARP